MIHLGTLPLSCCPLHDCPCEGEEEAAFLGPIVVFETQLRDEEEVGVSWEVVVVRYWMHKMMKL